MNFSLFHHCFSLAFRAFLLCISSKYFINIFILLTCIMRLPTNYILFVISITSHWSCFCSYNMFSKSFSRKEKFYRAPNWYVSILCVHNAFLLFKLPSISLCFRHFPHDSVYVFQFDSHIHCLITFFSIIIKHLFSVSFFCFSCLIRNLKRATLTIS